MNAIKKFFAAHSISTHTVVVVCAVVIGAYNHVPKFHDWVWGIYSLAPAGLKTAVEALVAAGMWYWKSRAVWTDQQRLERTQ